MFFGLQISPFVCYFTGNLQLIVNLIQLQISLVNRPHFTLLLSGKLLFRCNFDKRYIIVHETFWSPTDTLIIT